MDAKSVGRSVSIFWFTVFALCSLSNLSSIARAETSFEIEDVDVDNTCLSSAKVGDHLLFEYFFRYANGSEFQNIVASAKKPNQLFHLILVTKSGR